MPAATLTGRSGAGGTDHRERAWSGDTLTQIAGTPPQFRLNPRQLLEPLRPPLWLQWVLSLTVAALAIFLLVRFVNAQSTQQAQAPHISAKGQRILNQEAEVLDSEQQAPHVVHFAASVAPLAAVERAVSGYINTQIDFGRMAGPVRETLCFPVPGATGDQSAYRCSVLARDTSYPFAGVVNRATHQVVYCRHNPPPVPGVNVPLSARCLR